ncbi:hypothetical protein I551_3683 [Mycobacterium ulcerans str. Harvey]|uniref:Uncharacterized protein n=1 Tax=Mycobacterium ulcerans str. Harvey TaxID=1299332 RepID=A0ABP3AEZ0_MYCUL|nr:hypothetical protein I551_3683 [Mycobacterium ulcerans str. Harvey]
MIATHGAVGSAEHDITDLAGAPSGVWSVQHKPNTPARSS